MKEHYPRPEMHTFPQDFMDSGRISKLKLSIRCPLEYERIEGHGCFYQCMFFQPVRNPKREYALALYDTAIHKLEQEVYNAS